MRIRHTLFFLLIYSAGCFAEDLKYNSSIIPEELKEAAWAVVRVQDHHLVLLENGGLEYSQRYAITILEESGEELSTFFGPYDKNMKIRGLTGKVYNMNGNLVETLRGEDIIDLSMIASYSLYEDNRIKIIDPEHVHYPYTVEYTLTYDFKSFLDLPDWRIYPSFNVSVEKASYKVSCGEEGDFRYLQKNLDLEPEINHHKGGIDYTWQVENYPALKKEGHSHGIRDLSPGLCVGPQEFNYGGFAGDMSSWEEFGKWIWGLGEDKRNLSEEEIGEMKTLVSDLDTEAEKVKAIYQYMQGKVRYVNIKLGIGGFEPIAAATVSEVGYGDCKALSNYMKALLEAVGIKSWYTLVMAGAEHPEFDESFPSQQFNHAILAVPVPGDTIWLECTSQRLPAGYLGSFTDDRPVLLIDENGGSLSRTPKFGSRENSRSLEATCFLDLDGNAQIDYRKQYGGINFGDLLMSINHSDHVEQKRAIQDRMNLSGFKVEKFDYTVMNQSEPEIIEAISISVDKMLQTGTDLISLELGCLSEKMPLPPRSRNRKFSIYRKRGSTQSDSVCYILPSTIAVHSIPDPVILETDFGSYISQVENDGNQLVYIRKLIMFEGEFEPQRFNEYYRFLRQVHLTDQRKALLVSK